MSETKEEQIARIAAAQHVNPADYSPQARVTAKEQRRIVREYLEIRSTGYRSEGLKMSLPEFAEWVAELQEDAPEHYDVTVELEHETDYDGPGEAQLLVYFDREETDEEIAERTAQTQAYAEQSAAIERAEYLRLKAKFG